ETENQVSLYPCGMGAIYMAHQLVTHAKPGAKTIQLGFPYVDTLKLQEKCGFGAHFVRIEGDYLGEVATLLAREPIAAVFCEFPTNPLLRCVDMDALSTLLREHQVPLVVDDTVGSFANVDMRGRADLLVTSLTKFFSGVGDVMGGSLVLSSDSPFYSAFTQALSQAYEDVLWGEDAIVLADNAQDFEARMQRVNSNTETLCDYLRQQPQIQALYYPKYTDKALYDACKKPGGGYAGLFSIVFHNPAHAPLFYDALQVDKGPSLGTNFTLASPYTLLAHYNELDFAKASGVAPELVRVSVGIEATDDLLTRFKNALAALS
ncbi:MAG: PLP-dependent transferase, partial [Rickettsiales bacterium]